jgi:hypothetical protein
MIREFFCSLLAKRETAQETEQRIRLSIARDNLANIRHERRFVPARRTRAETIGR